jgi:hypothetical protein
MDDSSQHFDMTGQLNSPGRMSAEDVRHMLSSPVYAYGINLVPAERVAAAVMQLNMQLAQEMRDSGATFTLDELDQRFQALLRELETSGQCTRAEDHTPIISKEVWLQTQIRAIEKLSRGEVL